MPTFGPIKRKDLIRCLRSLGFEGTYVGGKHEYMVKGELKLAIPVSIRATTLESFWLGFCGKPGLTGMNGRRRDQPVGERAMEIHELVVEMKLPERRLTLYDEKYGFLSEDFCAALMSGKLARYDEYDETRTDLGRWKGIYETWLRRKQAPSLPIRCNS